MANELMWGEGQEGEQGCPFKSVHVSPSCCLHLPLLLKPDSLLLRCDSHYSPITANQVAFLPWAKLSKGF